MSPFPIRKRESREMELPLRHVLSTVAIWLAAFGAGVCAPVSPSASW